MLALSLTQSTRKSAAFQAAGRNRSYIDRISFPICHFRPDPLPAKSTQIRERYTTFGIRQIRDQTSNNEHRTDIDGSVEFISFLPISTVLTVSTERLNFKNQSMMKFRNVKYRTSNFFEIR